MIDRDQRECPGLFARLTELECFREGEICAAVDGFYAATVSVAEILARRGIETVSDRRGTVLDCGLFFDDWYLYAVSRGENFVYSLFKMREQEHDAKMERSADGDTPGVTVSFVALRERLLLDCLCDPTPQNRTMLNEEINRVVAYGGQRHDETLKRYFLRTESKGAYLIAKCYTEYIASLAREGWIPVPEHYAACYQTQGPSHRIPQFLEENNRNAGKVICDHEKLYICDLCHPTEQERLAILATHTGNTSCFSFAAEVQFHAKFLMWWAKIPLPLIGRSPYASAIRADMSIGDAELVGPTPYYRANSRIVRAQCRCHHSDT